MIICDHAGDKRCPVYCYHQKEHESYNVLLSDGSLWNCIRSWDCDYVDSEVECIPVNETKKQNEK